MSDSCRISFSVSFAMHRVCHARWGRSPSDAGRCAFLSKRSSHDTVRGVLRQPLLRSRSVTKVAIVDDHEALREGLEHLLADRGLQVVGGVGSAAAAEDLVLETQPDVALVDIRLPDESGIELTKRLLATHPRVRVVLYTGDADAELLFGGLDSGARGYALKTGSMGELVAATGRVAGGGSYVDPRLDRVLLSERSTSRLPQLSPRERQITHLMAEGRTAEAIGEELGLSVETIRTHVRNVIRKMRARNRVHAIALALGGGKPPLPPPPRGAP